MSYERIAVLSQVISAILFLVALGYIWIRFIAPAVLAAQEANNKVIAEAVRHRDEAKAALDLLNTEIEGAKRDADAIRSRSAIQGDHEKAAVIAEAREAGERSLVSADGELERARFVARERLRSEMLQKALRMARSKATDRIDAAMNAKLVDNFVTTLERENG